MTYLNIKFKAGIETVDQLDRNDFKTYREFKAELNRLVREYKMSGQNVYISSRPTRIWS